jgi:hypothetical protein
MKDLPTSIDSVFAKANKSAVKLEEVTQTDKVGAEIFDPRKSNLFNDKPRFQNIKERQTFFPNSPEWFHLGSRDAPLVRDIREISHLEILPQTDSNVNFCQQDYIIQRKAMTDKRIVDENASEKYKETNSPTLIDAAKRTFHHGDYDEATCRFNVTTDNEDTRHNVRVATVTCATESTNRKSLKDIRRETSRKAAAILAANKATLTANAQAAAATATNAAGPLTGYRIQAGQPPPQQPPPPPPTDLLLLRLPRPMTTF